MQKKAEKQVSGRRMVTVVMLNEQRLEIAVEVCKQVITSSIWGLFNMWHIYYIYSAIFVFITFYLYSPIAMLWTQVLSFHRAQQKFKSFSLRSQNILVSQKRSILASPELKVPPFDGKLWLINYFWDFLYNANCRGKLTLTVDFLILDEEHLFLDFDTKLSKYASAGWKEQVCLLSLLYMNCHF